MPDLTIIIASTRPGRAGLPIGTWFAERARVDGAFDVRVVDLADVGLPMYDEPDHPRLRRYRNQHTKDWSATIDAADAVVFVTPEYNYGYPASLKNAIDFLHEEWAYKPVGFVSYGGVAAGTRAIIFPLVHGNIWHIQDLRSSPIVTRRLSLGIDVGDKYGSTKRHAVVVGVSSLDAVCHIVEWG